MRKADILRKLFDNAVKYMNHNNIIINGSSKPDCCKFYNNTSDGFKRKGCLEAPITIPYYKGDHIIGFALIHPYLDKGYINTFTEVIILR